MNRWYYQISDDEVGPLKSSELLDHIRSGKVQDDTLIRKDDSQWVRAREVNGLFDALRKKSEERLCPYCGHAVEKSPSVCPGCGRKIVVAFSSRITDQRRHDKKVEKPKPTREEEAEQIRKRTNAVEIAVYSAMLLVMITLLAVGLYFAFS